MKIFSLATLFLLFACGMLLTSAQSRRITEPISNQKTNSRPSPSPTPDEGVRDSKASDDGEVIMVDTNVVSIPVRVMDRKGRFVGGLKQENFKVFEDGQQQQIAYFTNEAQPFTVALVLDMSYSSTFKIAEIQAAAISFIDQLRPADRVMVVAFDKEVRILCEATSDRKVIYKAISAAKVATGTSLYEAVDLIVNRRLAKIDGRKAMVLFTDGVDTTSESVRSDQNLRDALEGDSIVYSIQYDTFADVQRIKNAPPTSIGLPGSLPTSTPPTIPTQNPTGLPFPIPTVGIPDSRGTSREDYERAAQYLQQLSENTGGSVYVASTFGNLGSAFSKIASELREYYSIGFTPANNTPDGRVRRLKVQTDQKAMAVRARTSYIIRDKSADAKRKKTAVR